MKSLNPLSLMILALLSGAAISGPWFVDLEESTQTLPWVITGEVIEVMDSSLTVTVTESFWGDFQAGDSLNIAYWEMGTWTSETLSEGSEYLLIPDDSGSLQIVGKPGNGFWLLKGYFDFNAFFTEPGVLNRDELLLLCSGDSLPDRRVAVEIRFAGGSEFIAVDFLEIGDSWLSCSHFDCMDGLSLNDFELTLGGQDTYPYEPDVFMKVSTAGGGLVFFHGKIDAFEDDEYRCTVYPTGLVILDSTSLARYITSDQMPETIVIGLSIEGAQPADLGLIDDPVFTLGESGGLHLSGIDGMLDITSLYLFDYDRRPVVGFDHPMSCSSPLYFRFDDLPEGPSGHLATDIIDALAKGIVSGGVGRDPEQPEVRFSLNMLRE